MLLPSMQSRLNVYRRALQNYKKERRQLQLELTLEKLCDCGKGIEGSFYTLKSCGAVQSATVRQGSTADQKRLQEIPVRLNELYREIWKLEQVIHELENRKVLRPKLRWGKNLADTEVQWV